MPDNDNKVDRAYLLAALDSIGDMAIESLGNLRPEDAAIVKRDIKETIARIKQRLT